jgi:hypothetical protein
VKCPNGVEVGDPPNMFLCAGERFDPNACACAAVVWRAVERDEWNDIATLRWWSDNTQVESYSNLFRAAGDDDAR